MALLIGCSTTILTGLLPNRTVYGEIPRIGITYEPMLGVGYWGYILPWLRKIIYSGSQPEIVWGSFVSNSAIWSIISFALSLMIRSQNRKDLVRMENLRS